MEVSRTKNRGDLNQEWHVAARNSMPAAENGILVSPLSRSECGNGREAFRLLSNITFRQR